MKNLSFTIFFLLLLTTSKLVDAAAEFNFSGTLVEEPCLLDPEDSAIEIDYGTVISKLLYSHQRTAGKPFTLHLLECDLSLGESVSVTFIGTEDSEQPGLIALDALSTARGVAIGIETLDNKLIPVNQATQAQKLSSGSNELNFSIFVSAAHEAVKNKGIISGSVYSHAIFRLYYD